MASKIKLGELQCFSGIASLSQKLLWVEGRVKKTLIALELLF